MTFPRQIGFRGSMFLLARKNGPLRSAATFALSLMAVPQLALATVTVGSTPGTFGVDARGAATYTIPISVAPGINGLAPSVALVYDSQAGDGPQGMGWNLAGLSSISRCAKTIATNGTTRGIQFDSSDQFCLDGQPLVRDAANAAGAVYGGNGTLCRTEIDTYARVTSFATGGEPSYFRVQRPDGLIWYYGNAADSRIPAGTGPGSPILTWKVSQIQDKFNNSIRFTYKNSADDFNPSEIRWTDHCSVAGCTSGTDDRYKLIFEYEGRPTADQRSGFLAGFAWSRTKRLRTITYLLDGTVVQDYTLGYATPVGSGTQRSQLESVTQCGDSSTGCFSATSFQWANGLAGWNSFAAAPDYWSGATPPPFLYGDFDGDGRTDMLFTDSVNPGKWSILRATGNLSTPFVRSETTTPTLAQAIAGDFNADGLSDVMGLDGASSWVIQLATGALTGAVFSGTQTGISASTISSPTTIDYDGDRRPDLAYVRANTLYLRRNIGGEFSSTEIAVTGLAPDYLPANASFPPMDGSVDTADFDGDGRGDLLVHYQSPGANSRWFAYT